MQVVFCLQKFFYKNCIFTKKFFMLNQSSLGCFLEHLDLPYQFGILIMSTFCWNELFFTKANWIYAIWINVSPVFFASPLMYIAQEFLKLHDICVKKKISSKIREKLEEHFDIENRNFGKFWEHNFHIFQWIHIVFKLLPTLAKLVKKNDPKHNLKKSH